MRRLTKCKMTRDGSTVMKILYERRRPSLELIEGAFYGFDPSHGIDVDMWLDDWDESFTRGARIIRVDDRPYAAECFMFDAFYEIVKTCPYDPRETDGFLFSWNDRYFPERKALVEKSISFPEHRQNALYRTGKIDLCGGNVFRGIIPCFPFVIAEALKDAMIRKQIKGVSFFEVDIDPNQTQTENPRAFCVNTSSSVWCTDLIEFDGEDISPDCPFCGDGPLFCPNCTILPHDPFGEDDYCKPFYYHCRSCGKLLLHHGRAGETKIPDRVVKDNPCYTIVKDWQLLNIFPGEQWNGDDLFGVNGAVEGAYMMTRPMLEWMEENQYGPLLALPFRVDVSRCTEEQREKILALVNGGGPV